MIKFEPEQETRKKVRLNGKGILTFKVNIEKDHVMPITSEFAKKHKLFIYPDILYSGEAEITVINLSSYFVDLMRGDILAYLKPLTKPRKS